MARSDFGPEVKASMQPNANTPRQPPAPRGPTSPGQQVAESGRDSSGNPGIPPRAQGPGRGGMPGMPHTAPPVNRVGPMPTGTPMQGPGLPHVAAAASIAHAILGNRGLR